MQVKAVAAVRSHIDCMAELPEINPDAPKCLSLAEERRFDDHGIVSRTSMPNSNCRIVLSGFAEDRI